MADPTVSVVFGASTGQLTAQIAIARAQLASTTAQMRSLANSAVATGTTLDSGVRSRLQLLSATAEGLKGHLADLESEGAGASAFASLGLSARQATMDVRALVDEFSSGRMRQGFGSIAHLLFQVAAANPVLAALAGGVALVGGALAYLIVQANNADAAIEKARGAMAFAGTLNQSTGAVEDFISKFEQIKGVTTEQAGQMEATLGTIHNWSAGLQDVVTRVLPGFSASIGEDAPSALNKLAAALDDPTNHGEQFVASLRNSTQAERDQFAAALATGSANQENAAILAILAARQARYGQAVGETATFMDLFAETMASVAGASSGVDVSLDEERQRLQQLQQATQDNITAINARNAALAKTPLTPAQVDLGVNADVTKENPVSAQIEQAQSEVTKLQRDLKNIQIPESTFKNISESIDKAKQKLVDLQAQERGGTPTQLTDMSQAEASVSLGQDDLRTAQAKVAALRQELSTATEATVQTRVSTELAQAELQVREKIADISRANATQSRARAPSSDLSANLAEARANQAAVNQVYAAGSQQRIEAEAQVLSAQRAISEQDLAKARETEDQKYQAQKDALTAQSTAIKQAASEHQISYGQELMQLQANLQQQEALQRQHLQTLLQLYRDMPAEYAKTMAQLNSLTQTYLPKQATISREVNQEIYNDYKRTFEGIGNSVTSSVMQIIEGQGNLRTMARSVSLEILQQFIGNNVKWVADTLSSVAKQTAAVIAGQTAQTGAVQAGAAAQEAAQATPPVISLATEVIQAIGKLAGESAAGVFSFLAPVMGPAAAGPAAATFAEVLAYGSFATGAYNIDRNQLAMIHAGEMILPDRGGVASEFRSFMSGGGFKGAQGGAAAGGDTFHNHFSPTVNMHVHGNSELTGRELVQRLKDEHKRGGFAGWNPQR